MPLTLEAPTLLSLLLVQSLAAACLLPWLMGWQVSPGARSAQGFVAMQAAGWAACWMAVSHASWLTADTWLSLALACFGASLCLLGLALQHWLAQPRRWLPALLLLLALATVAVSVLAPVNRMIGASLGLGAQLLLLGACLLWPRRRPGHQSAGLRWRSLMAVALLSLSAQLFHHAMSGSATAMLARGGPVLLLVMTLTACVFAVLGAWHDEAEHSLRSLLQTDPITGLATEQALDRRARECMALARRFDEPLMLMLFCIEPTEDQTPADDDATARLQQGFAMCLAREMRIGDMAAHLEDNQFAVLMPRSAPTGPIALDQRVRHALNSPAQQEALLSLSPLRYSAACARLRPGDRDAADMKRRAQAALHEAKRLGGDQLVSEPGWDD